MPYDLVIRNGTVVDGSGAPGRRADVGVRGNRISTVGRVDERGAEEIDAEGHVVAPGFIDGHTHMDAQVMWDPLGSCSCFHGVTSVVMGNCGFTLAPARPTQRDLVVRNLERAEDISRDALAEGIEWTWETFPEYLDAIDRAPKAINYAAQIGHSALRVWAMGERAFEATAGEDDLRLMEQQLRDALFAGAVGFTTSRSDQHATPDDQPVASRFASWDEVHRLVSVLADLGAGVFEIARETAAFKPEDPDHEEVLDRLRALALDTGVPVTFGAMTDVAMAFVESIVARGGRAFGQTHSRGVISVTSFKTRLPFDGLPEWKQLRALPLAEQRRILEDPVQRERLVRAAHEGDYGRAIGAEARRPDYSMMRVLDRPTPPNPSIAEIAASQRRDPVDVIIDLGLANDFDQLFIQPLSSIDPEMLRSTMKHPNSVMTFSDAGAHVSQISDCSIQTHLLSYWVRDRQDFTLEEAVRMLTLDAAKAWGFADRGLVREGFVADLAVFDPETVGPAMPVVTADLPGGAKRLLQKATGFRACVVGGQPTLVDGEPTGRLGGEVIRGPLAKV
ncbi:MAG TPA: amidohydrolase family protein [Acidimicrobiales bacterium]|nr:amidohydrolase family protein [Acidimicrobiales bacterium]